MAATPAAQPNEGFVPASTLLPGAPRFCAMTGRPLNPYTATPAVQPSHSADGTPIIYMAPSVDDTNAAINSINRGGGGGDEEMTDADPPIIGGRVVIIGRLSEVATVASRSVSYFQKVVAENEMARRIKRATIAPALDSAADRIAEAVRGERPADRPVLRGLVQSEAERAVLDMKREIQSLRSRLDSQEKKKGRKNAPQPTEKNQQPSKDFRRRGGRAARTGRATNQTRGSPPKHGDATTSERKKPLAAHSANKSGGKKGAKATKPHKK